MSEDDVVINDRKLRDFVKALKNTKVVVQVGILGDKNNRGGNGNKTNAEIGMKHEFGLEGMPVRSFLRMPLNEQLKADLEDAGAFEADVLKEVIRSGSVGAWLKKIGVVAEAVILKAFDSGGFGKWVPSNMKNKKNKQTLVETQQLRNSITSAVKE